MSHLKRFSAISACIFTLALSGFGQTTKPAAPPDNTKVNERDRNSAQPTADQQKENASDRKITQQIRQSIIKDKAMSTYAKNIKIITQDGTVTLKGPVRSETEKKTIEAKADNVVGAGHVKNEIEVAPAPKTNPKTQTPQNKNP